MRALTIAACALLAGCATPKPLYTWGSYEELIYVSYVAPASVAPEQQIEKLQADYEKARAGNGRIPPGWHAHMGYLYTVVGKTDHAVEHFQLEKTQFPESSVFVDRLIANLGKP